MPTSAASKRLRMRFERARKEQAGATHGPASIARESRAILARPWAFLTCATCDKEGLCPRSCSSLMFAVALGAALPSPRPLLIGACSLLGKERDGGICPTRFGAASRSLRDSSESCPIQALLCPRRWPALLSLVIGAGLVWARAGCTVMHHRARRHPGTQMD